MKTKIIALLMMLIPLMSSGQTRLLSSFPTGDEVTKVYVGKAMLSLAENMMGGFAENFRDMMKDVKSIEAYSCENRKLFSTVADEFKKLLKTLNTEEVAYSEDDGEISQVFTVTFDGQKEPTAMLIYNSDKDDYEIDIVVIHGTINVAGLMGEDD